MKRRPFLHYTTTTALAALGLGHVPGRMLASPPPITLDAYLPNGDALPKIALNRIYFLDLNEEPIPHPDRTVADGRLISQPPPLPFAIALQLPVEGFGNVTLYADNQGRGFMPSDFPLVLNGAFARDRLHRVTTAISRWQRQGYGMPSRVRDRLHRAQAYRAQAEQATELAAQLSLWNQSLVESLWAGEAAALSRAGQRIARTPTRQDFKLGCNAFAHPYLGADYDRHFEALFTTATVPFYWQPMEPERGQPSYTEVDTQVAWLEQFGIAPKGHPLVWFYDGIVPDWVSPLPYTEVKAVLRQRILAITRRYGDRIPAYDVINEAHGAPWANALGYDQAQFIALTRLACDTAREGNPNLKRVVNSCCLWARNVALYGPPQRSPYSYLKACLAADIDFEVIGLQLYYPDQDMFEIDRLLDRFIALGKPIHITEMGCSSDTGPDENSIVGEAEGQWHAPWSEAIQADWVEQVYTLAYSKPEIETVSWWDLSDQAVFWPFGGLLNRKNQPKAAYYRLRGLKQVWGL
ncbi:endo-1,4-beta-xylanase [Nodosilinea sp. LEGE 07088]|uniref:endo-1,4-beta-xylanase n=1 Tax=Nodosilinea sp. LEGE 07088 TaxID=2777968 RepID=UPI00187F8C37|nr:endo-1,4-beta-xylanase [Nodosilinea sp. LEGE 07088]MBE9140614.1 endo-1,4-beta-xylanase [Nodosilinea sp. LEGE 07088]